MFCHLFLSEQDIAAISEKASPGVETTRELESYNSVDLSL